MRYLILSIAVMLGLSMSAQVGNWGVANGMAVNYNTSYSCLLGADFLDNGEIGVVVNTEAVTSSGVLVFDVDGQLLAVRGAYTGGSWVTAYSVDSDAGKLANMLKAGIRVTIYNGNNVIYRGSLREFTLTLNSARYQ